MEQIIRDYLEEKDDEKYIRIIREEEHKYLQEKCKLELLDVTYFENNYELINSTSKFLNIAVNYLPKIEDDQKQKLNRPDPKPLRPLTFHVKLADANDLSFIRQAFMRKEEWKECRETWLWNLFWVDDLSGLDLNKLLVWQRVNHFPHSHHLTRIDKLKFCLDRQAAKIRN